jgi:3-hydroxymyristoyl/3-hydroxydecanoyl-(acyl carrier protein) dehydratase|tara:strand:- start:1758 stop:2330 length:573 start_codon:yes stop_codon:yes gene_type:complete
MLPSTPNQRYLKRLPLLEGVNKPITRTKMSKIDDYKDAKGEISKEDIVKIIPYNDHFLFIDKVTTLEKDLIIAEKKLTGEEDFFKGHFAEFPIMPGALIIEGMGQAGTLLVRYNLDDHETKDVLAYKINETKFSAPTFPPATLTFELRLLGKDDKGALLTGTAKVDGKQVAETRIMLAVVDKKEFRNKSQ